MENISFAFNATAPVFILVLLGYFLRRRKVIDGHFIDTASDFAFKYLFPLVIFEQIYQVDIRANLNPFFILYCSVGALALGGAAWWIAPRSIRDRPTCGAFLQGIYRSNCGLMGVALATNVFGPEGSLATVLLLPFVSVIQNTGAVVFLTAFSPREQKNSLKRILLNIVRNPIIIGSVAGMAVSLLKLPVPRFLAEPVSDLAGMASTLAFVALGGQIRLDNFFRNTRLVLWGCLIKLVLSPLVILVPAILFCGFSRYELGAIYFIFGASTAVSTFIFAKAMGSNETLAAQMVVYTTVFSSVTMFCWLFVLRYLGFL